jgi:hypothetical protein
MSTLQTPEQSPYSFTVYVASPGTPIVNRDGTVEYSVPGHVYWSISDGKETRGFGFAPIEPGAIQGPGRVNPDDHTRYRNPAYERTMAVTGDQYARLQEFGEKSREGRDPRFDLYYLDARNNCVDYTWKALEVAGLDRRRAFERGESPSLREIVRGANDQFDGGRLRPIDNIDDLKLLRDPIPGHPANRAIERDRPPLPEDSLKNETARRLLSQTDPRNPEHPDHERYQRIETLVHAEDARLGRAPDEASANLTASLTVLSKREGIEPIHLAFSHEDKARGTGAGQNVFLFDGDPQREPWYQRASMPTAEAIRTPAAESFRELEVVNERLAHRQSQDETLDMQRTAETTAPRIVM